MEYRTKKLEEELKNQETQIGADNVVVDNARICCSYGQSERSSEKESTCLIVKANKNGSNVTGPYIIATEKDCKKNGNLLPFKRCYSPYYMDAVRMLYAYTDYVGENEENKKFNKYNELLSDYIDQGYGVCLHLLEEVWFEPSEKVTVNNMYQMEERLLKHRTLQGGSDGDIQKMYIQIKALWKEIPKIIKEKHGTGYYYDSILEGRYRTRWGRMDMALNEIEKTVSKIENKADVFGYAEKLRLTSKKFLNNYKYVYEKLQELDENVHVLVEEATWDVGKIDVSITLAMPSNQLKRNVESPEREPKDIAAEIESLPCYNALKEIINSLMQDFQEIIEKIENWTTDYSRVLTTDSFMVCRCGGVLEFMTSGQESVVYFNNLYIRTLEMVDSLIKHFQTFERVHDLYGFEEERFELKYAYRDAARISVKAYEYLTEGEIKTEEDERIPCNLHFEYVGKSVKEEEQQYLAALLTILGHVPGGIGAIAGMLSIGMTVYDGIKENLCEEENVSSIVSIFNSEATVEYKKAREAYPKDLKEFNKKLSRITDTFDVISAINYEIHDNWVDSIRAYAFTEEYMFFAEQFLNKECKKVGEIRFFQSVERKDYLNERRGSNIVWGEDPGVTYSVKTRVGVEGEREDLSQESFESDIRNKEIYK
ncbi:MAG: hypothetical protein HFG53_15570 [Lachnospiraceae bacterium]|jgi:hypothetical protein|nr:hypothetical protein [Lachnospiraceae bacterium]